MEKKILKNKKNKIGKKKKKSNRKLIPIDILNFLRTNTIPILKSKEEIQGVYEEAQYYGIDKLATFLKYERSMLAKETNKQTETKTISMFYLFIF